MSLFCFEEKYKFEIFFRIVMILEHALAFDYHDMAVFQRLTGTSTGVKALPKSNLIMIIVTIGIIIVYYSKVISKGFKKIHFGSNNLLKIIPIVIVFFGILLIITNISASSIDSDSSIYALKVVLSALVFGILIPCMFIYSNENMLIYTKSRMGLLSKKS